MEIHRFFLPQTCTFCWSLCGFSDCQILLTPRKDEMSKVSHVCRGVAVWVWQRGCGTLLPRPAVGCPSQCHHGGLDPGPSLAEERRWRGARCCQMGAVCHTGCGNVCTQSPWLQRQCCLSMAGVAAVTELPSGSSVGSGNINLIASLHPQQRQQCIFV